MNERIKELILQSVTFRLDPDSECYEAQVCPEDLESLAELIVQECIDTVSDSSVEYCTRPQIVSEIKEHFGVEE
jgi:hypothetical protein